MYKEIYNQRKIAAAQKKFLHEIHEALPPLDGMFTIGHQGDDFERDDLRSNGLIWFGYFKDSEAKVPKFWNAFGLASELAINKSNTITVEVNVALDGMHPRAKSIAALFAENENGDIALIHTGKVGGGKKGVGKQAYISQYKGETCEFLYANQLTPAQGIVVAELGRKNMAEMIGTFVNSVARFKANISLTNDADLSDDELRRRANDSKGKPRTSTSTVITYVRNKYVARYAKRRANGRCDLCSTDAPFIDADGEPYLECHHIIWLAHNGDDSIENTVALCPNCHRRMHILRDPNDVKKLQKKAT